MGCTRGELLNTVHSDNVIIRAFGGSSRDDVRLDHLKCLSIAESASVLGELVDGMKVIT